jgi:hypothetical protein
MNSLIFPQIDGHFWVVRDGKIIDWEINEYNLVRKINKCDNIQVHLEADEMTQKMMIGIYKKVLFNVFKTNDWNYILEKFTDLLLKTGYTKPVNNMCYQNCLVEIYKNGGELKFGSMGWVRKSGEVHYEFGGEDWKGVKAFLV